MTAPKAKELLMRSQAAELLEISVAQWDRLVREKNVQPDGHAKNPMYKSGPPMRLYSRQTIARLKRLAMVRAMAASAKARGVDTTARCGELDRPMTALQRWHARRTQERELERQWARDECGRQDVNVDDRPSSAAASPPRPEPRQGGGREGIELVDELWRKGQASR